MSWRSDGGALAGVRWDDHRAYPWTGNVDDGRSGLLKDVRLSHSLLGFREGPAEPVHWLSDGRLLCATVATERCQDQESTYDLLFDSTDGEWPPALLSEGFRAARCDLRTVDPAAPTRAGSVLTTGCLVELAPAPDGRHVLAGIVPDDACLADLLRHDVLCYQVYDGIRGTPVRDLGPRPRGTVRWATDNDAALVWALDDETGTAFWSADRPDVAALPAGRLPGGASAWLPITPRAILSATREGNPRIRLLPEPDSNRATQLEGPVTRVARTARTLVCDVLVESRSPEGIQQQRSVVIDPVDGLVESRLFADLSDEALAAGHTRQVLHASDRGLLVEERSDNAVRISLHRESGSMTVLHELGGTSDADAYPPPRVIRRTTPGSNPYELIRPEGTDPSTPLPVVLWLSPVRDAGNVNGPNIEHSAASWNAAGMAPPSPAWTFLPSCAVVTFNCPLQWDSSSSFRQLEKQLRTRVLEVVEDLVGEQGLDPSGLVLGGHSFGAASAAVVLASLPDVFACAILRSGAYNRHLTPEGFQHERRTLWQARDVYEGFTLANVADRIATPILLTQGTADPNSVTTVAQADAFYAALRAAGVPARLALLHNEGHILETREGVLAVAKEELMWIRHWTGPGKENG